ncbi:MAG: hypothetical protein Q8L48_08100 [Archangium sp.]|nr:hypothetical protein [Archangium sp.]
MIGALDEREEWEVFEVTQIRARSTKLLTRGDAREDGEVLGVGKPRLPHSRGPTDYCFVSETDNVVSVELLVIPSIRPASKSASVALITPAPEMVSLDETSSS